jgi:N,N'-diacetyllegionaminate synthase
MAWALTVLQNVCNEECPMNDFCIAGRRIGKAYPAFIIAEVGINHNGLLDTAVEMIGVAKRAGADAVKFQTFKASEFVADRAQQFTYQSQGREVTESMLAMFERYELPIDAWARIKTECDRQHIIFMSTPQNRSDLDVLLKVGLPAVKIGSDDFNNLPLIRSYAQSGLPLILSCGMSDLSEVHQALDAAGAFDGNSTALLLCTSQYPTPPADVNLRKLITLRNVFPGLVTGFSDHTQGPLAASLAVAMGAVIFEKHFTLDHDQAGPDHWFSEDPGGLELWVKGIRESQLMLGGSVVKPTKSELAMRTLARRSLVAVRAISRGDVFTIDNVGMRRPGNGLPPNLFDQVLGNHAVRDLEAGAVLTLGDIGNC